MALKDKRTYKERRTYLIDAVKQRRKKIRTLAIAQKGGKCTVCGYHRCQEALEFHHLTMQEKDFGISDKGYTRSWDKVRDEIEKCVLLCSNCHREVHIGVTKLSDPLLKTAAPPT